MEIENGRIRDYRIKTHDNSLKYALGSLKDFEKGWVLKSQSLGDLLGSLAMIKDWDNDLVIVKFNRGYAIGR